ncbi:hypothetical protein AAMO2058_000668700 [Amorphochlora amoebiformis]
MLTGHASMIEAKAVLRAATPGLRALGVDLVWPFHVGWYNERIAEKMNLTHLPTLSAGPDTLGVLLGNTKTIWPKFKSAYLNYEDIRKCPNPLDWGYIRPGIKRLMARVLTKQTGSSQELDRDRLFLTNETDTDRLVAMPRLAHESGLAWLCPVSYLSVHPLLGPWIGYRAVMIIDSDASTLTPTPTPSHDLNPNSNPTQNYDFLSHWGWCPNPKDVTATALRQQIPEGWVWGSPALPLYGEHSKANIEAILKECVLPTDEKKPERLDKNADGPMKLSEQSRKWLDLRRRVAQEFEVNVGVQSQLHEFTEEQESTIRITLSRHEQIMGVTQGRTCFSEAVYPIQGGYQDFGEERRKEEEFNVVELEGTFLVPASTLPVVKCEIMRAFQHCLAVSARGLKLTNVKLKEPRISQMGSQVYQGRDEVFIKASIVAPGKLRNETKLRETILDEVASSLDNILQDDKVLYRYKPSFRNLRGPSDNQGDIATIGLSRLSQILLQDFKDDAEPKSQPAKSDTLAPVDAKDKKEDAKEDEEKTKSRKTIDTKYGGDSSKPIGSADLRPDNTRLRGFIQAKDPSFDFRTGDANWIYTSRWSRGELGKGLSIDAAEKCVYSNTTSYDNAITVHHARGQEWIWEVRIEEVDGSRPGGLRAKMERLDRHVPREYKRGDLPTVIGLTDAIALDSTPFFRQEGNIRSIAYQSDGNLIKFNSDHAEPFGEKYGIGDVITIRLNQYKRRSTVEFFKNQRKQGSTLIFVHRHPLRLAAALPDPGYRVRLGDALNIRVMVERIKKGVVREQWIDEEESVFRPLDCSMLDEKLYDIGRKYNLNYEGDKEANSGKKFEILSKEWLLATLISLHKTKSPMYAALFPQERVALSAFLDHPLPAPDKMSSEYWKALVDSKGPKYLPQGTLSLQDLKKYPLYKQLNIQKRRNLNALLDHYHGYLPPMKLLRKFDWDHELAEIKAFKHLPLDELEDLRTFIDDKISTEYGVDDPTKSGLERTRQQELERFAKSGKLREEKEEENLREQFKRQERVADSTDYAIEKMLSTLRIEGYIESKRPPKIKEDGKGRHFDFALFLECLEEVDGFYLKEGFLRLRDGIQKKVDEVKYGDLVEVLRKGSTKKLSDLMAEEGYAYRSKSVMKLVRACLRRAGTQLMIHKELRFLDQQQAYADNRYDQWLRNVAPYLLHAQQEEEVREADRKVREEKRQAMEKKIEEEIAKERKKYYIEEADKMREKTIRAGGVVAIGEENPYGDDVPLMGDVKKRRLENIMHYGMEDVKKEDNFLLTITQRLRNNFTIQVCRLELNGQIVRCTDMVKLQKAMAKKKRPKVLAEIDLWFATITNDDSKGKWQHGTKYRFYEDKILEIQQDDRTLNVAFETMLEYELWMDSLHEISKRMTGPVGSPLKPREEVAELGFVSPDAFEAQEIKPHYRARRGVALAEVEVLEGEIHPIETKAVTDNSHEDSDGSSDMRIVSAGIDTKHGIAEAIVDENQHQIEGIMGEVHPSTQPPDIQPTKPTDTQGQPDPKPTEPTDTQGQVLDTKYATGGKGNEARMPSDTKHGKPGPGVDTKHGTDGQNVEIGVDTKHGPDEQNVEMAVLNRRRLNNDHGELDSLRSKKNRSDPVNVTGLKTESKNTPDPLLSVKSKQESQRNSKRGFRPSLKTAIELVEMHGDTSMREASAKGKSLQPSQLQSIKESQVSIHSNRPPGSHRANNPSTNLSPLKIRNLRSSTGNSPINTGLDSMDMYGQSVARSALESARISMRTGSGAE